VASKEEIEDVQLSFLPSSHIEEGLQQ